MLAVRAMYLETLCHEGKRRLHLLKVQDLQNTLLVVSLSQPSGEDRHIHKAENVRGPGVALLGYRWHRELHIGALLDEFSADDRQRLFRRILQLHLLPTLNACWNSVSTLSRCIAALRCGNYLQLLLGGLGNPIAIVPVEPENEKEDHQQDRRLWRHAVWLWHRWASRTLHAQRCHLRHDPGNAKDGRRLRGCIPLEQPRDTSSAQLSLFVFSTQGGQGGRPSAAEHQNECRW
mmetsp:Transcript_1227/g.2997  ORF Transcript_1227/g.2997 Transcript_1227/m.2997 type:complete len:233 (-) Transcript_1227:74-772(-)